MIRVAKRNGNKIEMKSYVNIDDFNNGNWCSWGSRLIEEINLSKSYKYDLYCINFCGNCYYFGTNWDIRCNKNSEPIHKVVKDCPKFHNALRIAKELKEKMESDKDFKRYCEIVNANHKYGGAFGYGESKLEVFLAIFNE